MGVNSSFSWMLNNVSFLCKRTILFFGMWNNPKTPPIQDLVKVSFAHHSMVSVSCSSQVMLIVLSLTSCPPQKTSDGEMADTHWESLRENLDLAEKKIMDMSIIFILTLSSISTPNVSCMPFACYRDDPTCPNEMSIMGKIWPLPLSLRIVSYVFLVNKIKN